MTSFRLLTTWAASQEAARVSVFIDIIGMH